MQNTFLEKTLESWLTRTSEIGYTLPFCQVLLAEGASVCHISRQNAFEQGKDIISLDAGGKAHGFQLKEGNITDRKWTTEVHPEIVKLRELPIIHPSIDRNAGHTSWLITNGWLEDTVRRAIDDLNTTKWRDAPLRTVVRGELLQRFLNASARFVPQELDEYRLFLELFFADGTGLVEEQKLTHLIEQVLRFDDASLKPAERKRNIAASVLYVSYILGPFYSSANHVACIQILTILYAYICAVAERYKLPAHSWLKTLTLLEEEIIEIGAALDREIANDAFATMTNSVWDGALGVYRRQLAVTYLAGVKLLERLRGDDSWQSVTAEAFGKANREASIFWGEGASSGFLVRFWLFHQLLPSETKGLTEAYLLGPLLELVRGNGRKSTQEMVSPYYTLGQIIPFVLGVATAPIEEDFVGRGYTAEAFVQLLARYGRRDILEALWRELTYISYVEYQADEPWQLLRWQNEKGHERSEYPKQEQSFRALKRTSRISEIKRIPKVLRAQARIIPLFLLAYPHRLTANLAKFADDALAVHLETSHVGEPT